MVAYLENILLGGEREIAASNPEGHLRHAGDLVAVHHRLQQSHLPLPTCSITKATREITQHTGPPKWIPAQQQVHRCGRPYMSMVSWCQSFRHLGTSLPHSPVLVSANIMMQHTQCGGPLAWEEDMKERVSHAVSSCPMICSCVWWFASAICAVAEEKPGHLSCLTGALLTHVVTLLAAVPPISLYLIPCTGHVHLCSM